MTGESNFTPADKLPVRIQPDVERDSCRLVHKLAYAVKKNSDKYMWFQCPTCGAKKRSWQKLREQGCWK